MLHQEKEEKRNKIFFIKLIKMFYEEYQTINSILEKWDNDRLKIFEYLYSNININKELKTNIWLNSDISNNNNCECDSNNCVNMFSNNNCKGCLLLSRLFIKNLKDKFCIKKEGKYNNNCYNINQTKISDYDKNYELSEYKLTKIPFENSKTIINKIQMLGNCENQFNTIINDTNFLYTKGCFVEHYFIISCIIEKYLIENNNPCIPTIKWIYQCNGKINTISRNYELIENDINNNFKIELLNGILLQLISILNILHTYGFIHGSPTFNSIVLENKICDYKYLTKNIKCEYTMHLNPSAYSSININNKRLFFFNKQFNQINNFENLNIEIITYLSKDINHKISCIYESKIPCIDKFKKISKTCYKIDINNWKIYQENINIGIPLFHSSLELYSFLISLLKLNNYYYYNILLTSLELLELWKQMWINNNYDEIMDSFFKLSDNPTSTEILIFLSNYYLRCDGLSFFTDTLLSFKI